MIDAAEQLRLACTYARERFADALAQTGFRPLPGRDDAWIGYLDTASRASGEMTLATGVGCPVEIAVATDFPYVRPTIRPTAQDVLQHLNIRPPTSPLHEPSWGWHREQSGAFCLYVDEDGSTLPWADAPAFLVQATAWLDQDHRGWPDDDGALDLERYLPTAADRRLVLYREHELEPGQHLKLKPARNHSLRVAGQAARTRKGGRKSALRWASNTVRVLDLGELSAPIRCWDDLLRQLGDEAAEPLVHDRRLGLDHVVLKYQRRGELGVVIAALTGSDAGGLSAMNAAPDDQRTRDLRGHPESDTLAGESVAVVGVGAIGATAADLLHRQGVGRLTLIDGDVLKPGNTTRHVLGDEYIGLNKATGMSRFLASTRTGSRTTVVAIEEAITDLDEAAKVLTAVDVVIDATADSLATSLLSAAARAGAGQLVSVCVLADGYAIRADVIPHPHDAAILEPPDLPPVRTGAHETGCSSPVSTTPPAAAVEAAAIATRVTTEVLLDRAPEHATEQRVISTRGANG